MVLCKVSGFRHAPGQPLRFTENLLLHHTGKAGRPQQALLRLAHHQRRHQVFKHGARPRLQTGRNAARQERTAKCHPVAPGHIALGYCHKTGQTRFRCQQVVVAGVKRVVVNPQANVKQVPLGVVKAAKVHGHTQAHAVRRNLFELLIFNHSCVSLACQAGACATYSQQVPCQVAIVNGRNIGRMQDLQCFGLVPVVQMPVMLGHAFHRGKSCLQSAYHILRTDPAELACACHCQQVQADVCGRCTVRERGLGVYLQIVWRQVIVKRGNAPFKKSPGVLGNTCQVNAVLGIKPLGLGSLYWQADPPRKNGG